MDNTHHRKQVGTQSNKSGDNKRRVQKLCHQRRSTKSVNKIRQQIRCFQIMSTQHVNKIGQQTRRQQIMYQPTLSSNSVNKYGVFSQCQKWKDIECMVWRHGDSREHGWVPLDIRSSHVWQRLVWFFYYQSFRYGTKATK